MYLLPPPEFLKLVLLGFSRSPFWRLRLEGRLLPPPPQTLAIKRDGDPSNRKGSLSSLGRKARSRREVCSAFFPPPKKKPPPLPFGGGWLFFLWGGGCNEAGSCAFPAMRLGKTRTEPVAAKKYGGRAGKKKGERPAETEGRRGRVSTCKLWSVGLPVTRGASGGRDPLVG